MGEFEGGDFVGGDDVVLQAADLGYLDDPPLAVAHALDLDNQIERRNDLGADGA